MELAVQKQCDQVGKRQDDQPVKVFKCCYILGTVMAARTLIQLFREKNPNLLHKKDRVNERKVFKLHYLRNICMAHI